MFPSHWYSVWCYDKDPRGICRQPASLFQRIDPPAIRHRNRRRRSRRTGRPEPGFPPRSARAPARFSRQGRTGFRRRSRTVRRCRPRRAKRLPPPRNEPPDKRAVGRREGIESPIVAADEDRLPCYRGRAEHLPPRLEPPQDGPVSRCPPRKRTGPIARNRPGQAGPPATTLWRPLP